MCTARHLTKAKDIFFGFVFTCPSKIGSTLKGKNFGSTFKGKNWLLEWQIISFTSSMAPLRSETRMTELPPLKIEPKDHLAANTKSSLLMCSSVRQPSETFGMFALKSDAKCLFHVILLVLSKVCKRH